eukprot:COSAG01_NODE_4900_length_4642_cov_34.906229_6_plen_202_part_00
MSACLLVAARAPACLMSASACPPHGPPAGRTRVTPVLQEPASRRVDGRAPQQRPRSHRPPMLLLSTSTGWWALVIFGAFGHTAQAYNNGYGLKPFLGWQSWCAVGKCGTDACYDRQIRQTATAMAQNGMKDLGFEWVVIDVRAVSLSAPACRAAQGTPPYAFCCRGGARTRTGLLAPHTRRERHSRPLRALLPKRHEGGVS